MLLRIWTYLIFGYTVECYSFRETDFTNLIPQINISIHPRLSKPELIPENGNGINSSNVPIPAIMSGDAKIHHYETGNILLTISTPHTTEVITSNPINIMPNGAASGRNIFSHASVAC